MGLVFCSLPIVIKMNRRKYIFFFSSFNFLKVKY